jgi:hypothetical protein
VDKIITNLDVILHGLDALLHGFDKLKVLHMEPTSIKTPRTNEHG